MGLFRAWWALVWVSFRRLFWSTGTLVAAGPLAICAMYVAWFRWRWIEMSTVDPEQVFQRFNDMFMLNVFALFVIPIVALTYATSSLGGDREERTLVFLLARPIPRWLVLVAKVCAALPLVVGITVGSFYGYCQLAGPVGATAWELYLLPVFGMALAYTGLFHLFAVMFRHSTVVALIYALFIEWFLGNMPGIAKRAAVSYYGRSLIYELGGPAGLAEPDSIFFIPTSAEHAVYGLAAFAVGGLVAAMIVFQRREYRDLT